MNRQAYCKALLSALIVCLSGGVYQVSLQAQALNSNATLGTGQLAIVEGTVELKPKDASQYWRVSIGTPFRRGDLLKIAASAKATVVCTDVTKHELTSGVHGLPCPPLSSGPQVISFDGAWYKINPTRSDLSDLGIPIIITPRKS